LKKILIIQTASIGDVILATPLIEKLHHHFPEASIDFLLKKGIESLFTDHPKLNKVLVWDKSKHKYRNLRNVIQVIRKEKYDYLINIQRFASSGLIGIVSGAKTTIGFNKNPFSILFNKVVKHNIGKAGIHEVERNLRLIEGITDDTGFPIKLYPSENDYSKTSVYKSGKYICIAPASLWYTKQYPAEKWIDFMKKIDVNINIFLLGSAVDKSLCSEIIENAGHPKPLNLAGKLSLLETAALMKDAHMNFVNDSAPQHLGSATNAPLTSIFCSTVPDFGFGPLSDNSVIIETKEPLDCRPCGLHGLNSCPEKHFKCAFGISTDQLLERIKVSGIK